MAEEKFQTGIDEKVKERGGVIARNLELRGSRGPKKPKSLKREE